MKNSAALKPLANQDNLTPASYRALVAETLAPFLVAAPQEIPLAEATGRVLAQDLFALENAPAFANSQMDGYALTATAASQEERVFKVGAEIAAGSCLDVPVDDSTVYPIMTGAPLPAGYDAVVPEEAAQPLGERQGSFAKTGSLVELPQAQPGQFVRYPGEDTRAGQLLIAQGSKLTPTHLGLLAMQGFSQIPVQTELRVLILTGGDEVTQGANLAPGQIRDGNGPMLAALLEQDGAHSHRLKISDREEELVALLEKEVADYKPHLVLSSGGISHGNYEVVKNAVALLTGRSEGFLLAQAGWFGHLSQQPGGPQGLILLQTSGKSKLERTLPWLAFPGNPVSTLISYTLILRPLLRQLAGQEEKPRYGVLDTAEAFDGLPNKTQYRRGTARVEEKQDGTQTTYLEADSRTGSHLLAGASQANALIEIAPGSHNADGDVLRWYRL